MTLRTQRCLAASFLLLLSFACSAIADESGFTSLPRSHWAYAEANALARAGLITIEITICFPSSRGTEYDRKHYTFTRYEFAIMTIRAMKKMAKQEKTLTKGKPPRTPSVRRILKRLANEFKTEIEELTRPARSRTT
jgi:hypothetical protein